METCRNRILSTLLFAGAPFYFYAPKAILNKRFGCNFDVAYYHFRKNHRNAVNLTCHVLCLFLQLFGNFALLHAIDERNKDAPLRKVLPENLRGIGLFSLISALVWFNVQIRAGGIPMTIKSLSCCVIAMAFFVAPYITPEFLDAFGYGGFLLSLLLSNVASGGTIVAKSDMMKVFIGLPTLRAAFAYLEQSSTFEMYKGGSSQTVVLCIAMAWVFGLPLLMRNPIKPLVISSTILLRVAYGLTGDTRLFFLSYGFFASLLQGITHKVVKEEATLVALERKGDKAKISFEYGHVVHFPNLALSAIFDALQGVPPPKRPEGLTE